MEDTIYHNKLNIAIGWNMNDDFFCMNVDLYYCQPKNRQNMKHNVVSLSKEITRLPYHVIIYNILDISYSLQSQSKKRDTSCK